MNVAQANQDTYVYEFGAFQLNPGEKILLRDGAPVALTPKAFDTLFVLVESSGHVLSKETLMNRVWPDSFVEEANLAQNISTLRKALNDGADGVKYIETLPKRGYRFVAQVQKISLPDRAHDQDASTALITAPPPAIALSDAAAFPPETALISSPAPPRKLFIRGAVLFASLLVLLPLFYVAAKWRTTKTITARRLAVLPFRNLKPDISTDYLGFPLADAIISKLGYISSLTVRPSSYISKYRHQEIDARKVAAELNVDTLLIGSYLREEKAFRITVQLIDVTNDRLLWNDKIDLPDSGQLVVQDRVAQEVINGLHLTLTSDETAHLQHDVPANAQAYEYYLRGVDLYAANEFNLAVQMLEKSVEMDAQYALAWAHLGRAHTAKASFDFGGAAYYHKAQSDYEQALKINPDLIEARIFMANMFTDSGRVEQAVPLLRAALTTNPNHPEAHWELGYAYRFGGMLQESIAEGERARQLDPEVKLNSSAFNSYFYDGQAEKFLASLPTKNLPPFIIFYRGMGNYYLKNWEAAAADFELAYRSEPKSLYTQIGEALRLGIAKQSAQGLALLRQLEQQIVARQVMDAEALYKIAQAFAELGDKPAALRNLQRSIEGGFFCYPYFTNDPLLRNIRNEAELTPLLQAARERHAEFKRRFF